MGEGEERIGMRASRYAGWARSVLDIRGEAAARGKSVPCDAY